LTLTLGHGLCFWLKQGGEMKSRIQIGELAKLSGITVKTVLHYHKVGLLAGPEHSLEGYRLYGAAELNRIRSIKRLKSLGISLDQIKDILGNQTDNKSIRSVLCSLQDEFSAQIKMLEERVNKIQNPLDDESMALNEALDDPIDHIGGVKYISERTIADIVAHELDLPAIEEGLPTLTAAPLYGIDYKGVKVDRVLHSDESLQLGEIKLHCIHTPGSISVYTDIDGKRVLFGQDIHTPFSKQWGSDLKEWHQSMQKLLELRANILCAGNHTHRGSMSCCVTDIL